VSYASPSAGKSQPVFLQPYSPELNPIERLWLHQVTCEQLNLGMLFPPQSNTLEVEIQRRVGKPVFNSGLARVEQPTDMVSFIRGHVSKPEYPAEAAAATKAG
jgi:hypothetical protein